ncbi:unnamed protein product [Tenebrio molitor]|nr:unnamed protein product [Tenebrio molitor]
MNCTDQRTVVCVFFERCVVNQDVVYQKQQCTELGTIFGSHQRRPVTISDSPPNGKSLSA